MNFNSFLLPKIVILTKSYLALLRYDFFRKMVHLIYERPLELWHRPR